MPLLDREARGVRLTPPGEAFSHHARGVLDGRADLGIVAGAVDTMGLPAIHVQSYPGTRKGP